MTRSLTTGLSTGRSLLAAVLILSLAATLPADEPSGKTGQPQAPARRSSKPTPQKIERPYAKIDGVAEQLLSLDVYPARTKQPLPVMVMIHGGGWRIGDKANRSMTQHKVPHFRDAGYVYVSINYRLSKTADVKHPTHVKDVARALAWVHEHIGEYGGDPTRIFLMGHSAGAHLAALVSLDHRYLEALGKDLSLIKGTICLDTAAYDIPRYVNELGAGPIMRSIYKRAFGETEAEWRDASPRHHVAARKHIPPLLFFHTGRRMAGETLSNELVTALRDVGVPAQAIHAADKDHAGMNACIGQAGDRYTRLIMAFLAAPAKAGTLKLDPLTPSAERPGSAARKPFGRLDRDADGRLSRAEFERWRRAPVTFREADADGDGWLTLAEAKVHPQLRPFVMRAGGAGRR